MKQYFDAVKTRVSEARDRATATMKALKAHGERYRLSAIHVLMAHRFCRENQLVVDIEMLLSRIRIVLEDYAPLLKQEEVRRISEGLVAHDKRLTELIVQMSRIPNGNFPETSVTESSEEVRMSLRNLLDSLEAFDELVPMAEDVEDEFKKSVQGLRNEADRAGCEFAELGLQSNLLKDACSLLGMALEDVQIYLKAKQCASACHAFDRARAQLRVLQGEIRKCRIEQGLDEFSRSIPHRSSIADQVEGMISAIVERNGRGAESSVKDHVGHVVNALCSADAACGNARTAFLKGDFDGAENHLIAGKRLLDRANSLIAEVTNLKAELDHTRPTSEPKTTDPVDPPCAD